MLCMSQQLKIELINSITLHGTHVVCNWFSTNWFRYDCAYVFDLKHRLCGKESGLC
ncbi:NADH dehydrogenase [ubiquinone] 1 beta subcomplex subunit 2 [Zea mays]|uniref:NADH dehydrogenase [ubiquinone] 1 beta subcomplex subunit 2 n=1 Tax=Zea mays TaxID=4577 RepID=A0A1D6FWT0_MAIZE|nr:NADH dehydrogenase [ubiquinone] 1 beta subcomplex subunit 2 [Zea mays]